MAKYQSTQSRTTLMSKRDFTLKVRSPTVRNIVWRSDLNLIFGETLDVCLGSSGLSSSGWEQLAIGTDQILELQMLHKLS